MTQSSKYKQRRAGRTWIRDMVRQRDNYTCIDCGYRRTLGQVEKHNLQFRALLGRIKNLDVHHIDGNCGKKSKGYDSLEDMEKLITICHKCHYNRPEHKCKSEEWADSYRK